MVRALRPLRRGDGVEGAGNRRPESVFQFRVADDIVHELFVLLRMTKDDRRRRRV